MSYNDQFLTFSCERRNKNGKVLYTLLLDYIDKGKFLSHLRKKSGFLITKLSKHKIHKSSVKHFDVSFAYFRRSDAVSNENTFLHCHLTIKVSPETIE